MIVGLVGSCDLLLTWVVCGSLDLWFGLILLIGLGGCLIVF